MENDFDIELEKEDSDEEEKEKENEQETAQSVQLPMNFLTLGEIETDDVKVYIKQDVYKALEELAASDTTKELGSIIIGDYANELGKTNVIISEFVEAKYTDASASTLTFTHKTWDYVHSEHERLYPDKKIIGWQHTHPNYGIFLSNYDMFIQENFFNLPFQIAYVIDPIQNIRGFFQWKNGKVEKLKGYYIYDEIGKKIKIDPPKVKKEEKENISESKPSKLPTALIAVLCAVCIMLSIIAVTTGKKFKDISEMLELKEKEIASQSAVIDTQSNTITGLEDKLVDGAMGSKASAADLIELIESDGIALQNKNAVLAELKAFIKSENTNAENVSFVAYTVVAGDNLCSICEKNNINYNSAASIILALNGIANADEIHTGQTILLPITA